MRVPRTALGIGACSALAAAAQPWFLLAVGDPDTSSLAAVAAGADHYGLVARAMLAFVPVMFVAYWTACVDRWTASPFLALSAALAFSGWFILEILPRSFDVWVVHAQWSQATPDRLDALADTYARYQEALYGVVFVRRHALLAGQAALAIAVWRQDRAGRALALALGLSVVRLTLGTLASYGDWHGLDAVADPLYFVTAGLTLPLLAVWMWSRWRAA
jgi:hypothetical protein